MSRQDNTTQEENYKGIDRMIRTWLTTNNRPWTHDPQTGVFTKTRNDCSVFEPSSVIDFTKGLLGSVGITDATVCVEDNGMLRIKIPEQFFNAEKIASLNNTPNLSVNMGNQSKRR